MRTLALSISLLNCAFHCEALPPEKEYITGPYNVSLFTYDEFDPSGDGPNSEHKLSVWFPVGSNVQAPIPLISYAHGMFGGGITLIPGYDQLLHVLATFGYVVAAPHACSFGCFDNDGVSVCESLPEDPRCFGRYYYEQLAVFEWAAARKDDPAFVNVDWEVGFGIAGHSMGGQATVFSSAYNASNYNIKSAV